MVDDPTYNLWSRYNSMVMSWILSEPCNNSPTVFQIKQLLHGLVQGSSDVSNYFTRLKTLWDELREFRPFPICSCGGMKESQDLQQEDYILQFLMGLNESYSHVHA